MALLAMGFQGTVQWCFSMATTAFYNDVDRGRSSRRRGFAAALHYMNIWVVLALSILANFIPTSSIMRSAIGKGEFLNKYGHYIASRRSASLPQKTCRATFRKIALYDKDDAFSPRRIDLVGATKWISKICILVHHHHRPLLLYI